MADRAREGPARRGAEPVMGIELAKNVGEAVTEVAAPAPYRPGKTALDGATTILRTSAFITT